MLFVVFICVGVFTFSAEATEAPKCSITDDTPTLLQDKDCSKYWQCVNGKAYLLECPNGLHFNKNTLTCDWPDIALCSLGNSREELDSDERGDLIPEYENIIYETCNTSKIHCPVEDGEQPVYFPLPNCTQFCQCSNGLPYLHNCPAGLHFNPTLNVCDYPQNAGCVNGNGTDSIITTTTENGGNEIITTTENSAATTETEETYELCPETVASECPAVDGEYPVYIPLPDCTQFCQCSNGLPYLHNCPDGLHFNPVLNVCDWPQDAGCASGNETDITSTTESTGGDEPDTTTTESEEITTEAAGGEDPQSSTVNPDPTTEENIATTEGEYELCPDTVANECPAVDGEHPVYIPLPDCTQFCQCSNGLPYLHNCPDGLHFNPVLNVCDWPQDAGCASGNETDITSTTESTGGDEPDPTTTEGEEITTEAAGAEDPQSSTVTLVPTTVESIATTEGEYELCPDTVANECPAVDGEHPVYIPLPDCTQFCQCSNGLPYLHNCPDGLHFNPVLNVCDWPQDAGCASGNETDITSTTESTGGDEPDPTTTESEEITTESAGGEDPQSSTVNPAPTTEESIATTEDEYELCPDTVANECPAVDGEHPVYIPLPDCTQFCQCSNGLPYLHNCPDGLHFNPVLNVCDWPQDAGCANGNETDVTSTTESTEGDEPDPTTTESEEITTEAAGGEDPQSSTVNPAPTTEESIATTESEYELCPDTVANECPAVDGEHSVYVPLPDCTQFCQCSNGLPYLHNCPDDLHFNPVLNVCDWPQDAGCTSGNGTDITSTTESTGDDDLDPTTTKSEEITTEAAGGEDPQSSTINSAPTTEESIATTESEYELCPDTVANECPAVDGEHPVYIPLPDCTQFCQCSNGLPYLHNCPDGLHFNPALNVCDWPQDAGCASGNETDITSTTESTGGDEPDPTTAESEEITTEAAGGEDPQSSTVNPVPTTEESIATTEDQYELCPDTVANECPAVDGEHPVYIPLPDCTQFCQCSNGLPYLHNCPDGLHFNPALNVCDWPQDAGCASGNETDITSTTESTGGDEPDPTTAESEEITTEAAGGEDPQSSTVNPVPTTEESIATTEDQYELCPDTVTNECPAVDGEHPVYIPLPDCTQFCQCSNGLPYLHNCPDGLHFNPVLNVCDWPQDAGCASGNETDITSTTESTEGDEPDPATTEGEEITTEAAGGEDPQSSTVNPAPTTEESIATTESEYELCPDTVANECPAVDGEHPVYVPLPDCTQFCQCSNGLPYLHNCPDGLHFNPVLNVCDWPQDAGCASGNETDITSTTESTVGDEPDPTTTESEEITTEAAGGEDPQSSTVNPAPTTEESIATTEREYELCPDTVANECPAVDGEHPVYIPLPDCTQFCQCSNGLPYLHNCPDGLHFNPVLNVCDWPQDAGCTSGNGTDITSTTESTGDDDLDPTTTESEEITTEAAGGEDPQSSTVNSAPTTEESIATTEDQYELCPDTVANECPAVDGEHPVYIPLPDCTQFCQCSNGLPYLHNCPDGLHFNPVLNVCDWPQDAGCANGNETDVTSTTESTEGDEPDPTTTESEEITTEAAGGEDPQSSTVNPAPTTEESIATTESEYELCPDTVANECPAVDGEHPVYVPLPDCTQFCQCSNGLPYLHNCPDDLHFNPVLNVCDWPQDAGCVTGNGTDVASTTEDSRDDESDPAATTEIQESTTEVSDEEEPLSTVDPVTTTDNVVPTTESVFALCPDAVASECPAIDGEYPVYIPLPNCTQFCQCSNGLPYLHYCPADLHFNPVLNVCDYPENAQCNGIPS